MAIDRGVSARRTDAVLLAGLLLVVAQTVVRAVVVVPSYYSQDDFHHRYLARELGLSAEYLVRDHNGHLEIGLNLVVWLIGRDAGLSFLPAALSLLILQLVASLLLLAVLRQVAGPSPWLLVPFAGYLFTPLALPVATWWAAGLEALPLQIALLAAVQGLLRALRGGSRWWTVAAVAGHALGLLFYEKALLVLPTLVAVLLLVEWADEPLGRRLRLLVRSRPLLPHLLLTAAYVPLYLSVVDSTASLDVDPGRALSAAGETVSRLLLPGVLGGPWTGGAENTVFPDVGPVRALLAGLVVLAVVGVSVRLRGARAVQAWVLVCGYVAVDLALVQLGRADFLDLVVRDPRYLTDALPVIAIGTCAAFARPPAERRTTPDASAPRAPVGSAARSAAGPLAAVAALVASSLFSTALLAEDVQHRDSRAYVEAVLAGIDGDPAVSVLNTELPFGINLFAEPADVRGLLRTLGEEREFDRPGTELRMFDGEGRLWPVLLLAPRLQVSGPVPGCGWPMDEGWQPLGDLPAGPELAVLQVDYRSGEEGTLHVSVGGDRQQLELPPGSRRASFVVTGREGPVQARVTGAAPGAVCVEGATVGAPWPDGAA
ncbi:hypothetical protein [Trujillonella humicola]|uniref:hypothetical protein n=1 Tax=Trujillonella humicola TaxID=3383699 RepID=UPI003905ED84